MFKEVQPKNTAILGVLSILVILVAGYFFVVSPIMAQRAAYLEEVAAAENALDMAQQQLFTAQRYERDFPLIAAESEVVSGNFPQTADVESLNRAIIDAASKAGLAPEDVASISTSVPSKMQGKESKKSKSSDSEEGAEGGDSKKSSAEPRMAQMTVTISVNGNINSVIAFLKNLGEMDRTILVNSASLSGEDNQARASISAVSYMYGPIPNPAEQPAEQPAEEDGVEGNEATEPTTETETTNEEKELLP